MSTLFRTSRLLKSSHLLLPAGLALGLVFGVAGCSATSGRRTGAADSKMKTLLSVGDKPMPVVTGEPGSIVTAETGEADGESLSARRRARPDGRISGRVYDTENRPVPGARVRLAVGGASGGKVVSATTDRSGAFTLHGLRPGSDYTVIAEWDGENGPESGRVEARTADTDVRISLGPADEPPARASAPTRVNRVSDREPGAEDDDTPGANNRPSSPAPGVNEEDLPPAREAEAMAPAPSRSTRGRDAVASRPDGWRRGGGQTPAPDPGPAADAPVDPEARGTGAPAVEPVSPLDDGENPLPPALEPIPESSAAAEPEPDPAGPEPRERAPEPDPFSTGDPRTAARQPTTGPTLATRQPAASSPFESPTSPTEPPAEPRAKDAAPGALVVFPETFGPVAAHDTDPFASSPMPAPAPAPAPEAAAPPARPARTRPVAAAVATTSSASSAPKPTVRAARGPRRPTWGEVVASISTPAAGAVTRADEPGPSEATTRTVALRSDEPALAPRAARPARPVKTAFDAPQCEYDDRHRRIMDFRLPDLDGKSVRFLDMDSDLVLIDFWGTWCPPCLRSIPHLVELQERLGSRLKVVGIACEADTPAAAAPKVAETIRKMNLNYPVLLSRNDGSCPLQEALHIQAYPTMILVDRQGRVLWRDQGATPATLARLDRVVDSAPAPAPAPQGDETRRY